MFFVISSFLLRLRGYDETYLSIFLAAIAVIAMWLSFFFISYVNMKVHYISKKLVHPGHLELGHTVNFVYYFFFRFFLIHRVCFVAVPGYRVYRVPPQNIYHYIYCTDDSFFLQYFSSFFVFSALIRKYQKKFIRQILDLDGRAGLLMMRKLGYFHVCLTGGWQIRFERI